jgi:uncharacterized FlaG/YvyC family protein
MEIAALTSTSPPLPSGNISTQNQDRRALANAITTLNQSELWPGRSLRIHFDLPTHSLTVQVVNSESDEVLEQIPAEQALRMAMELGGGTSADSNAQA